MLFSIFSAIWVRMSIILFFIFMQVLHTLTDGPIPLTELVSSVRKLYETKLKVEHIVFLVKNKTKVKKALLLFTFVHFVPGCWNSHTSTVISVKRWSMLSSLSFFPLLFLYLMVLLSYFCSSQFHENKQMCCADCIILMTETCSTWWKHTMPLWRAAKQAIFCGCILKKLVDFSVSHRQKSLRKAYKNDPVNDPCQISTQEQLSKRRHSR